MMPHELLVYAVTAMCLWAIVHPAIPTCILGTAGLCCVGVGALLTLDYRMQPAVDVVLFGVLLGVLQIIWRTFKSQRNRQRRRMTDWAPEWQATEPPREVDLTPQRRVSGGRKE
jgi:membrane protein implicated in regulation of membrane protease activity